MEKFPTSIRPRREPISIYRRPKFEPMPSGGAKAPANQTAIHRYDFDNFEELQAMMAAAGYYVREVERVRRIAVSSLVEGYLGSSLNPEVQKQIADGEQRRCVWRVMEKVSRWVSRRTMNWLVPGGGFQTFASLILIAETQEETAHWTGADVQSAVDATEIDELRMEPPYGRI